MRRFHTNPATSVFVNCIIPFFFFSEKKTPSSKMLELVPGLILITTTIVNMLEGCPFESTKRKVWYDFFD